MRTFSDFQDKNRCFECKFADTLAVHKGESCCTYPDTIMVDDQGFCLSKRIPPEKKRYYSDSESVSHNFYDLEGDNNGE